MITHALLPVIGIPFSCKKLNVREQKYWNKTRVICVGLAGALPDILNPHFSLSARYSSWSHSLPALLTLSLVLFIVYKFGRVGMDMRLFAWMTGAYGFHLICDIISGGIAWLNPFSKMIVGVRLVPFIFWIPLDMVCVLAVYFLYRVIPDFQEIKAR